MTEQQLINRYRIHRRGQVVRDQQNPGALLFKEAGVQPRFYRFMGDMTPYVDMMVDVVAIAWYDGCGWMQVEKIAENPIAHFDDTFVDTVVKKS